MEAGLRDRLAVRRAAARPSYMDEVYHLRSHVHLVRSRLGRIAAERERQKAREG